MLYGIPVYNTTEFLYSTLVQHTGVAQHTEFLSILQIPNFICIDLKTFRRSCTCIIQYAVPKCCQEFSFARCLEHTEVRHTGVAQHTAY